MLQKILSEIEPHLPSQYKEIAKHFSYVFVLRVLQQFISFVSFFFIVHHVPKEVIGHYHFVLSVIALISITSLPGIRNALMQSIARHRGGFFYKATKYSFLSSLLGSLTLIVVAVYHFFVNDIFMVVAFMIAAAITPFSQGLLSWRSSLAGEERFKVLSIIDTSATLVLSLMLMASAVLYVESHIVLLSIALIVPAIQNIILWGQEKKRYIDAPAAEENMVEYGLKTSGYQAFPILAREIDKLSVYNFMSAGDLAAYNIAMKIPEAVKSVFQNLGDVIMPKFARIPKFTPKMDKTMGAFSFLSLFLVIGFAFTLFPLIFKLLVPTEYKGSIGYAQALLCTVAVGNHGILRGKYIKSQKDAQSFKKLTFISSIVKILSAPALVFFYDIWGAVFAIFVQRVFISVYTEYLIRTKYLPE